MNTLSKNITNNPILRSIFLFVGPLLSLAIFSRFSKGFSHNDINSIKLVLVLIWSPLFFSIPALIMQNSRDSYHPHSKGLVDDLKRALNLIPDLLKRRDGASLEMASSLLGWLVLGLFLVF